MLDLFGSKTSLVVFHKKLPFASICGYAPDYADLDHGGRFYDLRRADGGIFHEERVG